VARASAVWGPALLFLYGRPVCRARFSSRRLGGVAGVAWRVWRSAASSYGSSGGGLTRSGVAVATLQRRPAPPPPPNQPVLDSPADHTSQGACRHRPGNDGEAALGMRTRSAIPAAGERYRQLTAATVRKRHARVAVPNGDGVCRAERAWLA